MFRYKEYKSKLENTYNLHHHAVELNGERYYNVFIVGSTRYTTITEGSQKEAMKKAFDECLCWLERVINTNGTFTIYSNAAEIATINCGTIELIDATEAEEILGKREVKIT